MSDSNTYNLYIISIVVVLIICKLYYSSEQFNVRSNQRIRQNPQNPQNRRIQQNPQNRQNRQNQKYDNYDDLGSCDNVKTVNKKKSCIGVPLVSRATGVQSILNQVNKELVRKKKVSFNNINNYANFNDYVNQNGVLDTPVDKMAECRTATDKSFTSALNKYGKNIGDIYNNMNNNVYTDYKKACNVENIKGYENDDNFTYTYQSI